MGSCAQRRWIYAAAGLLTVAGALTGWWGWSGDGELAPAGADRAIVTTPRSDAAPSARDVAGVTVTLAQLPRQAQETYSRIHAGGPFPYDKDGTVFGNRERLLPAQPRGYYREYTVRTPGVSHRGARRIVCGGEPPQAPQACWYTADHYASFRRILN